MTKGKGKKRAACVLGSKLLVMQCISEITQKGLAEISQLNDAAWAGVDALEFTAECKGVRYAFSCKALKGGGK